MNSQQLAIYNFVTEQMKIRETNVQRCLGRLETLLENNEIGFLEKLPIPLIVFHDTGSETVVGRKYTISDYTVIEEAITRFNKYLRGDGDHPYYLTCYWDVDSNPAVIHIGVYVRDVKPTQSKGLIDSLLSS